MRFLSAAIVVVATMGAAKIAAGDVPPSAAPQEWTLDSLTQLALTANPTIRQVVAEVNIFRGLRRQAGLYPNPQVGYVQTSSNGVNPTRSYGAFLSQEFITAGKLRKAQAVQDAEIAHASANYEAQCRRVRNDVELRFFDALILQESLQLAKSQAEICQRDLNATEARRKRKRNKAELSEVIQARMRLRGSIENVKKHEIHFETAWRQLVYVVGLPDLSPAKLQGKLDDTLPELDWDSSWAMISSSNPLLSATVARYQIASSNYALEKANAIPNVSFQVIADRDSIQGTSTVSALVSIPLPLINRNQGNIDRAIAETHEAVAERERTMLALKEQLAEAFGRYNIAKSHVTEIREQLLPLAEENLDAVRNESRDDPDAAELFEAESTLVDAKISLLDARYELRKSVIEIQGQLLTGALNPAEIGAALQTSTGDMRRNVFRQSEKNQSKQLIPALQLMSE